MNDDIKAAIAALGREGGFKAAANMSSEARKARATKASNARWERERATKETKSDIISGESDRK